MPGQGQTTHFNKVSGVNGVFIGSATAGETRIADSTGLYVGTGTGSSNYRVAGTAGVYKVVGSSTVNIATQEGLMTIPIVMASTAAVTTWIVAPPYAATMTCDVGLAISSGTGRIVSVTHGSAGNDALALAAQGASGTIGVVVAMTASAVPTCSASEILRVVAGSCATAQTYGVTITFTKTV